jgi:hypothetical protein
MSENENWFYEIGCWNGSEYPRVTNSAGKVAKFFDEKDLERITQTHNNLGITRSIYLYNSENNATALKRGDFVLDFDAEEEPEKAREEAIQAVEAVSTGFNLFTSNVKIYFSGGKGFHVIVPFEAFCTQPLANLNEIYKRIAVELKDKLKLQTIDLQMYDASRLVRIENSIHPKTKLFKIPLSFDELKKLSVEEIKGLAKTTRNIEYLPISGEITKAKELFEKFQKLAEGKLKHTTKVPFTLREMPPYIKEIIGGVSKGGRNRSAFTLSYYFHRLGWKKEDSLDRLKSWNQRNNEPLPEEEIKNVLESAYKYEVEKIGEEPLTVKGCFFDVDGLLLQQIKNIEGNSQFCSFDGKSYSYLDFYQTSEGVIYKPNEGKEIDLDYLKLAQKPEDYGSIQILKGEIFRFMHKYLDVQPTFEFLAVNFIIFTWVFDKTRTTPYLRGLGDTGVGKSRLNDVIGSICYNPLVVSGAATVAPIYRIIPKWNCTLIFEESDLKASDETNELVKIINCGFEKGKPVIRCDPNDANKIDFFDPFCPKIFAARHHFEDVATESRCLSTTMRETTRKDIPHTLSPEFYEEAQKIRNKLLKFRLETWRSFEPIGHVQAPEGVEPRLMQIASPMLPIFTEEERIGFFEFLKYHQKKLIEERANSWAGQYFQKLLDLTENEEEEGGIQETLSGGFEKRGITYKNIADEFNVKSKEVSRELSALGFKTELRHFTPKPKDEDEGKPKRVSIRALTCTQEVWETALRRYTRLIANDRQLPEILKSNKPETENEMKVEFRPPYMNVPNVPNVPQPIFDGQINENGTMGTIGTLQGEGQNTISISIQESLIPASGGASSASTSEKGLDPENAKGETR